MRPYKIINSHSNHLVAFRILLGINLLLIIPQISLTTLLTQTKSIETIKTKLIFPQELDLLFNQLANCQCVFVRNGSEHSPEEAISHMKLKLSNSGGRIQNIPHFIEYIATKSSFTGSVYKIRWRDGKEEESATWLIARAKELNIYHK